HGVSGSRFEGPADFTLREGEIMGLTGMPGSGRRALLRTIAGLDPLLTGDLHLSGRSINRWSAARRLRAGLISGMAGEEAIMNELSVAENLLLPRMTGLGRLGGIVPERKQIAAIDWMEKLRIRPGSV